MNCKKAIPFLVLMTLLLTLVPIIAVAAWPVEIVAKNTFAAPVILLSNVVLAGAQIMLAVPIVFYMAILEFKRFGAFGCPGPPRFVVRFYTAICIILKKSFSADHNINDECSTFTNGRTVVTIPFQASISLAA